MQVELAEAANVLLSLLRLLLMLLRYLLPPWGALQNIGSSRGLS